MRLDVIATDRHLVERIDATWIDPSERSASRPSDHAALIYDFHLDALGEPADPRQRHG